MRLVVILIAIFAATTPAKADFQPFVDYARLFAVHIAEITLKTDADGKPYRELVLEEGLIVRCEGENGADCATSGANIGGGDAGCLLAGLSRAKRVIDQCEGAATEEQRAQVSSEFAEVVGYVADNALPRRNPVELAIEVMETRDRVLDLVDGGETCNPPKAIAENEEKLLAAVTDPIAQTEIRKLIATPRVALTYCGAIFDRGLP